jgi:transglutaminase-like putative cysteine protease
MKYEDRIKLFNHIVLKKINLIFLFIIVFGSIFLGLRLYPQILNNGNNRYFTITMKVTYENPFTNEDGWFLTEYEREISLFMNNSLQTVYLQYTTFPIEYQEHSPDGNSVAFMSFPNEVISPGHNLTYEVTYHVIIKQRPNLNIWNNMSGVMQDIPPELQDSYCRTEGPWQVNNTELQKLAFDISGNETKILNIVSNFINFIKQNIVYQTKDIPRYPKETLDEGIGDCDDQANLLITLCRVVGIPAYLQIGCIYIPAKNTLENSWEGHRTTRLSKIGWHGWAMVYISPWGWLPVDLTYSQGNLEDPINAINGSALLVYPTVQYMNITRTDYINTSINTKDFIIENGYNIITFDLMESMIVKEFSTLDTNQ